MNFIPELRMPPSAEEYLSELNPEQRAAVEHAGSPLLILAGAGSGKTRVITTKIAYLIGEKGTDPRSILAVTFTKKAANEMAERAHRLHPDAVHASIRTFHSFGAWFLRRHAEEAGIDPNFTVYDDDDTATLLGKAVPALTRQEASRFAHKIALAKDYCLAPDSPELSRIESAENFPAVYSAYQERLGRTGNIDFGDLIMLPVKLMQTRSDVREHMHRRFRVVMVDEYQDANVAQFMLLQQLAGPETYVCVVGDDDQSIYRFRGAEVRNILTFPEHFPGTTTIKLERNYRSITQVLDIANDVIRNNAGRFDKELKPVRKPGEQPVLVFLDGNRDETEFCAQVIQNARAQGIPYSDWAVLYRTNFQSLGFETEFLHRKIPYVIVGSLKFYEREEVKDVLSYLALLANPRDEVAFRRVINKPPKGVGEKSQDKIVEQARRDAAESLLAEASLVDASLKAAESMGAKARGAIRAFAEGFRALSELLEEGQEKAAPLPVEQLAQAATSFRADGGPEEEPSGTLAHFIERLSSVSGFNEYHAAQDEIAGTQRVANLQELASSAAPYPLSRDGLLDFLDHIELDRSLETQAEDADDAVTFITVHNTKGLEFPRVIITGMESGIFPRTDKLDEELEEERRLFYVGITRARDQIILTSCRRRNRYGRYDDMNPSPFLLEIKRDRMKLLGSVPYAFRGRTGSAPQAHPLAGRLRKGSRVFHDEYGYGCITAAHTEDGEFVVTVQFESGHTKKFMPEYQRNSLMPVQD